MAKNIKSSTTQPFLTAKVSPTYPASPASGDPAIVYGVKPAVATSDKDTVDNLTPVMFGPALAEFTVNAVNDAGNSAVSAGDTIYYVAGDTPVLSKKKTGIPFGFAFADAATGRTRSGQLIAAGSSAAIQVQILAGAESSDPQRVNFASVSLTNAEIKALRATPKTLVAAPGAGLVLEFVSAQLLLKGATNALTETADNLAIKYENGAGAAASQTIETTGFIDQTASTLTNALPKIDTIVALASAANKALVLHNTGDGEFGGNAANDAVMTVFVAYRVKPIS